MKKILTLLLIHRHPHILLGMKKRGFGAGKWNGFGGKVTEGETIEEAARRELLEEAGIEVSLGEIEKVGILEFSFEGKLDVLEVHYFRAENFSGEPIESEEMRPEWFHVDEIPLEKMWPDDKFWMPMFLEGKKFKGKFLFDNAENILAQELFEVVEIENEKKRP